MKYARVLAAVFSCNIMLLPTVWSLKYHSLSHDNENMALSLPTNEEDHTIDSRFLQNFNCEVSVDIDCFVVSDQSDCKDLYIRRDLCDTIDVMMNYKYCNLEDETLILRKNLTEAMFYNNFDYELNERDMDPFECRVMHRQLRVDTCKRNWISASLKIEGWKGGENRGNYCYNYTHYFPRINKYDPPELPTWPKPEIRISQIQCYLEATEGSGLFNVPCNNLNLLYFENSVDGGNNVNGVVEIPTYVRNFQITFDVESGALEDVDVLGANILLMNEEIPVVEGSDGLVLAAGETLAIPQVLSLDFAGFSGRTVDIISAIETRGQQSLIEDLVADRTSITIPPLEFDWELVGSTVECFVESTPNQSCQDYIIQSNGLADTCTVGVLYQYVVKITGTKCEEVTSINSSIISDGNSGVPFSIPIGGWSASERLFCPGEEVTIRQPIEENLCARAGKEVGFRVQINDEADTEEIGVISFLVANEETGPETPFVLGLDPNVKCFIKNGGSSQGNADELIRERTTCQDHLAKFNCNNNSVVENVSYRFKIRNTGDACLELNTVKLFVGNSGRLQINAGNWNENRRNFCAGESITLNKNVQSVDLCEYDGSDVDVKVVVNQGGGNRKAFGSISFAGLNNVPIPVPPGPTPATPPGPTPGGSPACEIPQEIQFKIVDASCDTSRVRSLVNENGLRRKRRRLSRNKNNKSGKNKAPASSPTTVDFPSECNTCEDHVQNPFSGLSSWKRDVKIYSMDDSSLVLYEGTHMKNQKFTFKPEGEIPECLVMMISEYNGSVLQTVSFDTSSCSLVADSTPDGEATYGAVRVCSFE